MQDDVVANEPVDFFKGLSDRLRLRIVGLLLRSGELCVCQIQGALGMTQYAVSRHLRTLRETGWVRERRQGRWVHYAPAPATTKFHQQLCAAVLELPLASLELVVDLGHLDALKSKPTCKE